MVREGQKAVKKAKETLNSEKEKAARSFTSDTIVWLEAQKALCGYLVESSFGRYGHMPKSAKCRKNETRASDDAFQWTAIYQKWQYGQIW